MTVLDASVILKWFFGEEGSDRARLYRERHVTGEGTVAVPDLFFYEAANVLSTKAALGKAAASEVFSLLWDFDLEVYALGLEDFKRGMALSAGHRISLYDAAYIELAEALGAEFVTSDRRLYAKAKGLGRIRLL